MDLIFETVLDVYTYKNRKFLCQIKVDSNSGKFKNCRCLSQQQWMEFDKNLEKLIATIDDWNIEKCLKFNINPCIIVKIQKSNLSLKHFKKSLGIAGDLNEDLTDANCILECIFDFKRDFLFSSSIDSQKYELPTETLDCTPCSPFSYDPYTPSKANYEANTIDIVKTPGTEFFDSNENSYSPKSITGKIAINECNRYENFPKAVINTKQKPESWLNASTGSKDSNNSENSNDNRKKDEGISPEKDRSLQVQSSKFLKTKESQQCSSTEETNYRNPKKRTKSEDHLLELNDENAREKHRSKRKKHKNICKNSFNDGKPRRKRLINLNEFSVKHSKQTEKFQLENKTENVTEESCEKADSNIEISSHFGNEKKDVPASKQKNSPEGQRNNISIEDKAEASPTRKPRKLSKTPMENDNSCESTSETFPDMVARKERKVKLCSKDTAVLLRRSERSPSKPVRFTEQQPKQLTKSVKKHKTSNKSEELFQRCDNEDDLFEIKGEKTTINCNKNKSPICETPVSKKPIERTSSSSSRKNKPRRDKSAECQQEKRDMSKWLSKRNSKPSVHEAKAPLKSSSKLALLKSLPLKTSTSVKPRKIESDSKGHRKSATPSPITIELPSKEELELMRNKTNLMREENAKIRAELDKMRSSPPKEVEILSLENMPEDNILSTFITYKGELDEVYQNNRNIDYIKGHDGINHCFIIRLLQPSIQMKMLEKLTHVYGCSNSTRQATLFANALLPEWVMRVFMEKFSLTRQQAIDQIKAQEAFQLHMDEQNENSFEFD